MYQRLTRTGPHFRYLTILVVVHAFALNLPAVEQVSRYQPKQRPTGARKTSTENTTLLFGSDAHCDLFIDREKVGRLSPHGTKKIVVGFGEHVVMAMDESSEVIWRKQLLVQSVDQIVVNVKFRGREDAGRDAACGNNAALMWTRTDNKQDLDWHEAISYCENLSLAEHRDWRLPTIDELQGLYDPAVERDEKIPSPFRLSFCCMWSSTHDGPDTAFTFYFNINEQNQYTLLARIFRVLCVRCP
jgi:hypothetical protein